MQNLLDFVFSDFRRMPKMIWVFLSMCSFLDSFSGSFVTNVLVWVISPLVLDQNENQWYYTLLTWLSIESERRLQVSKNPELPSAAFRHHSLPSLPYRPSTEARHQGRFLSRLHLLSAHCINNSGRVDEVFSFFFFYFPGDFFLCLTPSGHETACA